MVVNGCKKTCTCILLLVLLTRNSISHRTIKDIPNNDWEYDEILNDYEKNEILTRNPNGKEDFPEFEIIKKAMDTPESKIKKIQFFDASHPHTCSCGMEFRLIDLGPAYFPRYIPTGLCNIHTCGPMRDCVERQYKIRVLKERSADTDISNEVYVPTNLREFWTIEFVMVTVSCECHNLL